LQQELNLDVAVRTVQRDLTENNNLAYLKRKKKPEITAINREKRLQFSRDYHTWKEEWENVIFSDEKQFNLDGPDGWGYY
jgi:hypothetical protein